MNWRLWGILYSEKHRGGTVLSTTPLSRRKRGNKSTALWDKLESVQHMFQGDKIRRAKEKHPGKAKNLPSGYDTTQIMILPYNFWPFLTASTQGKKYAISELRNVKTGNSRSNDTSGIVCTTAHSHTGGQLWQKYTFQVCKTRHQIWILESGSQWHIHTELMLCASTR